MAYIGKQPTVGNFVKLDTITTSATTTFNLTNGGVAYYPQSANHCLVSLNGILQAPTDSFTISGSTIIFSSALTTSDVIDFIIVLGDVLNIGTPSDNTVSLAKLTATGTKDATTFLRGDNTFATAGATAGQVIQVVNATTLTADTTTSDTFVDSSLSASITPASSSNKIFVIISSRAGCSIGDRGPRFAIFRGATNITGSTSTEGLVVYQANGNTTQSLSLTALDSPSTTSSVTYKLRFRCQDGTSDTTNTNGSTGKNSITLMEIKG